MATSPQEVLQALLTYLRKDADSPDAQELDRLASAAIAIVERETGWSLAEAEVTELHDGDGTTILFVRRAPLSAVSALSVDGISIAASTGVTVPGYLIDRNTIRLRGYTFTEGVQNVSVTLTGGYVAIPADFLMKIVEIAAFLFTRKASIGQASAQFDRQTVTYLTTELSDGVKSWLASTRRMVF